MDNNSNRRPNTKAVKGPKGNEDWDLRIIRGGDGRIILNRRDSKETKQ